MNPADTAAAQRRLYELLLLTVCLHMAYSGSRITMALFALMELKATALTVGALISLLAALPVLFSVHGGRYGAMRILPLAGAGDRRRCSKQATAWCAERQPLFIPDRAMPGRTYTRATTTILLPVPQE